MRFRLSESFPPGIGLKGSWGSEDSSLEFDLEKWVAVRMTEEFPSVLISSLDWADKCGETCGKFHLWLQVLKCYRHWEISHSRILMQQGGHLQPTLQNPPQGSPKPRKPLTQPSPNCPPGITRGQPEGQDCLHPGLDQSGLKSLPPRVLQRVMQGNPLGKG